MRERDEQARKLRDEEHWSFTDIGTVLGVTPQGARKMVQRARAHASEQPQADTLSA